jgi:signal transduction histidine kinase/ligand-binding sensor domain-containing protein/DNA-binding response OmpR family regulator
MWFGTISGLNRFDGYTLKVFRNDPRDPHSIINDDIIAISEDHEGKLWLYTNGGMDIFDPATESFLHTGYDLLHSLSIPGGMIRDIKKDKYGNYWYVHTTEGLYQFNPRTGMTKKVRHHKPVHNLSASDEITAVNEDNEGKFWIIHRDGTIVSLDPLTTEVLNETTILRTVIQDSLRDYGFIVDSDKELWAYAKDTDQGVFRIDTKTGKLQQIDKTSTGFKLNTDIVRGVIEDNNGLIWVATDHGGVNLIDKKRGTVRYILHHQEDKNSLGQNSINVTYKDNQGIIWIGTFKSGVSFYHPDMIRFPLYRHHLEGEGSLPFDDVNAFAEDDKGNLWIGTNGGGLIYFDRSKNSFKQFLHDPKDPNSLSNNVIVCLFIDHTNKLWIGTYFGGLNCYDDKKFTRYQHDLSNPHSLADNNVWEIYEDRYHALWIGTISRGVDRMDREKGIFEHFPQDAANSVHTSYVPEFEEDADGNLWIGTGYGIDIYNYQTKTFQHILSEASNPSSLSNNSVMSMLRDSRGNMWIGTHGGLNLYNKQTKKFRSFKTEDGLPHNSILTLQEDNQGAIWVSTPNGLSKVEMQQDVHDEANITFTNYDELDGLQGQQFTENAALKTSRGELVFGGGHGFNIFQPEDIRKNTEIPSVVLTDFQVFNRHVGIGEQVDGRILLEKVIAHTPKVFLKHLSNVFSIEFTALSFFHQEKTRYKYKLEGFNKDWVLANAEQRQVTYTNLDPGEYTFKVMASNNDGVWGDESVQLKITVLPPFWKTRAAFFMYIVVVLAALLITRRLIQKRERVKFAIEQERREAMRMHELDVMKIKFFTNISHEFRTPLTLILTPIEKILRNTKDSEQASQFQLIQRNAKRLLNLVNQLLDFRKMEVQELKFNRSEGDIISFIKDTVYSFSDLSEKKDIKLNFKSNLASIETLFDQDKLEKILFNLLSNAFKFTPQHGSVTVDLTVEMRDGGKSLVIAVSDTGIGIPFDKQEKIFERFFQHDVPGNLVNQGSGIGLSITKEFVRIHGGSIDVKSEVGVGSTFTVVLPLPEVVAHEVAPVAIENISITPPVLQEDHHDLSRKPLLLLVEDYEDFRFYLKDNLKLHYRIVEAKDGVEGWSKALSALPDLIVSDVMMPGMNGMELCRKIKNDSRVSHIPVILLTARTAEEQKLEGYQTGADEYITKPFSFEILQSRIRHLIHQRELFHQKFNNKIDVKASAISITSLDEKLIQKAIKCVEEKISDPDFSVEDLSRELGMSRVHLYKKLQALTGKSPLEFIRSIRLQHAAQLLEKSQLTVSEVAYKVGFNNPKYFAKYFREAYQILPSAYASSKRHEV